MTNIDGLYNKNIYDGKLGLNHRSPRKLHFKVIDNATILPHKAIPNHPTGLGGILDANGNFIEESFVHHGVTEAYTPYGDIIQSSQAVIYFNMIVQIWGHCLTDGLRRAWFFQTDFYKNYLKNLPIVYVPMWQGIVPSFAKILEILELDVSKLIPITQPTKFAQVILPDESFFEIKNPGETVQTVYFTQEYFETVERIKNFGLKNFRQLDRKKFYFWYGSNQVGEERLANFFASKGYLIIRPEAFPFEEQLNILLNCENYASTLGSISHNSIFLRDGTQTIYIPRYPSPNIYQLALDNLQNLDVHYIDSSLSIFYQNWRGPYLYIISEQLKKFFGEDWQGFSQEDFELFLTYTTSSMTAKYKQGENIKQYYSTTFAKFLQQLSTQQELLAKYDVKLN